MTRRWMGGTSELVLAAVLLVSALAVDFLWFRPQQEELERLLLRRAVVEKSVAVSGEKQLEGAFLTEYVSGGEKAPADWLDVYRQADPLPMLERIRHQAGLRRLDLRLGERADAAPFTRTTYFMSVQGSFTQQVRFLKALELATPLVIVDSFRMTTGTDDPGVTASLDISVLTLNPEATP